MNAVEEAALAFRPINTRNAVLEGIAVLGLSRPFIASESDAIRNIHMALSLDLPKLEDVPSMTMFVGPGLSPNEMPSTPFTMSAYQRDGALESRLLVNPQFLAANFLVYTRWEEHWAKALLWFRAAMDAVRSASRGHDGLPPVEIATLGHQIVDVFPWDGDAAEASASLLLQGDYDRFPRMGVRSVGEAWAGSHTFTRKLTAQSSNSLGADLYDRLACNLGEEAPLGWRLRLDHLQEMRLHAPQDPSALLNGNGPLASRLLGDLHERNRELVRSLLSSQMLASIGLRLI